MVGIRSASAIAMALLMVMTASAILFTEDSDAYNSSYSLEYESGQVVDENLSVITGKELMLEYSGALPDGLTIDIVPIENTWYGHRYNTYLRGTLTAQTGSYTFKLTDDSYFYEFKVSVFAGQCTVTYDAGIGLVHGQQTWSETVTKGTFASLPQATHSTGAYSFMGWAVSETAAEGLDSYTALKDITLHAVWKRNAVQISDASATITSGQSASLPMVTSPVGASLSVVSFGGLSAGNVSVNGHEIILDMVDVEPGTYYITVGAAYSGYISGESVITVRVPITIVKPIEYVLTEGDVFSYTPVTNPSNADISLMSVTFDGNVQGSMGGLSMSGRSISGSFERAGVYAITYKAFLQGYVDVISTVFVKVNERQVSAPAPIMGTISATPRATEPRVYDFVISGYANASNIIWSIDGKVFSTSSPTAIYEFPTSGSYIVKCTLAGFDGSFVSQEIEIFCLDNYHKEAAWSGIPYSYMIEGNTGVLIDNGSPFSSSVKTVGGREYTAITGTPDQSHVGNSYRIIAGSDIWIVCIYDAETSAPFSDFDISIGNDGFSVSAEFSGRNASFFQYDFDGDGIYDEGTEYIYAKPGLYTVACKAVNNISETTCYRVVSINVVPSEKTTVLQLTDFEMLLGEKLDIALTLNEGDAVSVSGSAVGFVTIEGSTLRVAPVDKGVFDLIVSVISAEGTVTDKTVKVTVRGSEIQNLEDEKHDYMVIMAVFFVISVIAIAVFILRDLRPSQNHRIQSPITRFFQRSCRRQIR